MACSPLPPEPTQLIKSIKIIGEKAIYVNGTAYDVGTNLSNLFQVVSQGDIPINQFIGELNKDKMIFDTHGQQIVLLLNSKPDRSISQPLTIRFNFLTIHK